MTTAQRVLMGTLIALACSLLLNAAGVASYLKQRDVLVQARAQLGEARGDASEALEAAAACSASLDSLEQIASVLEQQRDTARAAAAVKAKGHNARADAVLAAPTPVPGDACASAAARFADWQGQRKQEVAP